MKKIVRKSAGVKFESDVLLFVDGLARDQQRSRGFVINAKGGCGKSTIAMNVASGRARYGHRVLRMDLDTQAQVTQWLAAWDGLTSDDTLVAALMRHQTLSDVTQATGFERMSFVASADGLEDLGREISQTDGYPPGSPSPSVCTLSVHFGGRLR